MFGIMRPLCLMALICLVEQLVAQPEEYEYGSNAFIQVGAEVSALLQKNPQAGQGKNQTGLSLFFDGGFIQQKYKSIWENDLNLAFSFQKNAGEPTAKGQDMIRLASHYAFTTSYNSKWYTAVDFLMRSQFAPAYDGGTLTNTGDSLNVLSRFLSPLRSELSIGEEYRVPQSPIYFFGGVAANVMFIADDAIAQFPAMDRDGNVIGSLHGNDLGSNSLFQAGLTLKSRYRGDVIADRINYDTNFRFFIDLLKRDAGFAQDNSPIDIEWNNNINFIILEGLNLSFRVNMLYDKDVVFVEDSGGSQTNFTKSGFSINSNILLSFRKSFSNED